MAFDIENGIIRRYVGAEEEVRVPDGVTAIFDNAFSESKHVKRVILPAGLKSVGHWAFNRCQLLESVVLPEGLESIGRSAFRSCIRLRDIVLPSTLTTLGGKAFEFCKSIQRADIPAGIREIGDKTFSNCSALRAVTIPGGVARIGGWAFEGCIGLESVAIPDSVSAVGEGAFLDCAGLQTVTVGKGVRTVGGDAFSGTPWLEENGDDFFAINGNLLRYTGRAKWVVVPSSITAICAEVFERCREMEGVVLPDSVTRIGDGSFEGCPALRRAELHSRITELGNGVFELCKGLEQVAVRGLLADVDRAAPLWRTHTALYGETCTALTVYLPVSCGASFRTVFHADEHGVHAGFSRYFSLFRKTGDTDAKIQMALARLVSPHQPEPGELEDYRSFLTEHLREAMRLFLARGDLFPVRALGALGLIGEDAIGDLTQMAAEAKNAEISAYLLAYKREHFGFHAPTFDL